MSTEFPIGSRVYYYINHAGIYKADRHKNRVIGTVVERPKPQRKPQRTAIGVYVRFGEGANAVFKNVPAEKLQLVTEGYI